MTLDLGDTTMTTYYKAVRPDGTDFYSGTVRWLPEDGVIPFEGWVVKHPTSDHIGLGPDSYLSVATVPTDCTGMEWPCRLLLVVEAGEEVSTPDPPHTLPNKRASVAWRVVAELPAHEALGPQGTEVAAIIERIGRLTRDEIDRMDFAIWGDFARPGARYIARNAARNAAASLCNIITDVSGFAAYDATLHDAWNAARDAMLATIVRDLITPDQYTALMSPWWAGVGRNSDD